MKTFSTIPTKSISGSRLQSGYLWTNRLFRRTLLIILACVPLLTPYLAPVDPTAFVYPWTAATMLLAAWLCRQAAQRYKAERVRWETVMIALCVHALAYALATARNLHWIGYTLGSWLANAGFGVSWILFLPALMGVRAVRGKWIRALDYTLAILTCICFTQAMGSGSRLDSGVERTMVLTLSVAGVTIAAFIARFVSASGGLRYFASVASMYLFSSFGVIFLIDVVDQYWVRTPHLMLSNLLTPLPQLLLCDWIASWKQPAMSEIDAFDPVFVDSLQPSIMSFGGVLLALYGFRNHTVLGACAVVTIVVCYAFRTHFFYVRLFREQRRLRDQALQMEALATRDPLTGIANRRFFDVEAEKLLSAPRSYPCSMILVDADEFKRLNDSFGHPFGDEVLIALAASLSEITSQVKRGCCARIGGDEFGALWPGIPGEQAAALAENLRARIADWHFSESSKATVSVGVATAYASLPLIKLLAHTDDALYQAKESGRNAVNRAEVLERERFANSSR